MEAAGVVVELVADERDCRMFGTVAAENMGDEIVPGHARGVDGGIGVVVELAGHLLCPDAVPRPLRRRGEVDGVVAAGMLATDDRRELAIEVVTRHEVAAGVLRRGDEVRAVLGRVRPRAVRVARIVGDAAVILTGQGDRPECADARTLGALVTFVALVSFRPLGSLGSARASWPGRPLLARGRYPAQATRPTDVPGDPLETLVAVAELQVAQRLAVPVRLDAGVDDAVADAELAPVLRRPIAAREGDRRAHEQRDERRDQGRRPHSPSFLKAEPPSVLSQDNS